MTTLLEPLARSTHLLPGDLAERRDRNRAYLMRLSAKNLLLPYYREAGLLSMTYLPQGLHDGWDSPVSPLRGTFTGHWLSAAARTWEETGDGELKARADFIVSEIGRCQKENGGEWCFAIPEKYLAWLKRLKSIWAPHYVCHKTMMGLLDMHRYAGNEQALEIVRGAARWFGRFTGDISRDAMTAMMAKEETGGILELWADLYAVTKDPQHLELARRYERPELFDPLSRGEDVLTNMHANATIPEAQGVSRLYEVTGEERLRKAAESYWDLAVRRRGTYATGGQTAGEIWTPLGQQAARLGELNQEHCTVYNMMRLCEYQMRWNGRSEYGDYWERNLYNGVLAQGHWQGRALPIAGDPVEPARGLITYFLPLAPGSRKKWGSETGDFWCCHCTLVQANANHREGIYYRDGRGLLVSQYQPSSVRFSFGASDVTVTQTLDTQSGGNVLTIDPVNREVVSRPSEIRMRIAVEVSAPVEMDVRLRIPWWVKGSPRLLEAGKDVPWTHDEAGYAVVRRAWRATTLTVVLPKGLSTWPLPDRPDTVAFLDGPVLLAGLVPEERMLLGDPSRPDTMLAPDDERHWAAWQSGWHTVNQPVGWRFKPLYQVGNETYTVYFPVRRS